MILVFSEKQWNTKELETLWIRTRTIFNNAKREVRHFGFSSLDFEVQWRRVGKRRPHSRVIFFSRLGDLAKDNFIDWIPILFTFFQFFSFQYIFYYKNSSCTLQLSAMLAAVRHGLPGQRESPCERLSLLHFFHNFTGICTAWKFYGKTMWILISRLVITLAVMSGNFELFENNILTFLRQTKYIFVHLIVAISVKLTYSPE